MNRSAWLSCSRLRISAWTVTSSAVVGSSANSRRGPQARARAIITRWRMPPDSWCGYSSKRRSASGMPTERSMVTALILASCRLIFRCKRSDSVICLPIVITGLSELIGSWKTIAISAPHNRRISCR